MAFKHSRFRKMLSLSFKAVFTWGICGEGPFPLLLLRVRGGGGEEPGGGRGGLSVGKEGEGSRRSICKCFTIRCRSRRVASTALCTYSQGSPLPARSHFLLRSLRRARSARWPGRRRPRGGWSCAVLALEGAAPDPAGSTGTVCHLPPGWRPELERSPAPPSDTAATVLWPRLCALDLYRTGVREGNKIQTKQHEAEACRPTAAGKSRA